jgi:superfamily I DNA/RNA helicase
LVGGVDSVSADAFRESGAGYSFSDFAVLFRTRAVRDALLPSLLQAGLPVTFRENVPLCGAEPFLHLLSALRFLENPRDAASLARLLGYLASHKSSKELWEAARSATAGQLSSPDGLAAASRLAAAAGLAGESRKRLESFARVAQGLAAVLAEGGVPRVIERLLAEVIHIDRQEAQAAIGEELVMETARECGADLSALVRLLSTLSFESEGSIRTEKISLLTFHAAKGLEFPVAFVAGAEEGITPLPEDPGEERRLFYVALTRAADRLFISHCATRRAFGVTRSMQPSSFLATIPQECLEKAAFRPRKDPSHGQLSLFP